jgi:hypothetical protein
LQGDKGSLKPNTPRGSQVDEFSVELKHLKIQRKIKKLKTKKGHEVTSSSSNEESGDSFKEEIKNKKDKKGDKRSYNSTSFNYDNLPSPDAFTSVPVGKVSHFDGTNYTKWKYGMNMQLISLNMSVWKVVCIYVDFSDEGDEPDFEQLQ